MAATDQPKVLAGIDGSSISASVTDYAAWISQRVGVPLKLLHNIEHRDTPAVADLSGSIGLGSREMLLEELTEMESRRSKIMMEQGKAMLTAATERAQSQGVTEIEQCQRHGGLAETLVELEEQIRVLVLGIRGEEHDEQSGKLGHQLETVIRALHRPVLVANCDFVAPQRLLLAYDGSEAADKALEMLATSPLYKGIHCHVAHVCKDDKQADALLNKASERLKQAGLEVTTARLNGLPEEELLNYQQQQDIHLIVMGSFGHSRLRELLLGSFTLKMLMKAKIPLLLLR
ncbi:Universal stress protein [Saliniradius amylolyticus]|uniref:Universal stress protein n=1 Tax=Saliniradius amylolyticus TaxID=2183582 RepID=A0A2S2E0P5_9ALTE|nr:universal stress protein [Saliniradius amylolyticus]AWL11196.1 Universal stress protein [Saliniradius amylolyticus]